MDSAGCPLNIYIVPVESLGTNGINQCGHVRRSRAGCRDSSVGAAGWRIYTGTIYNATGTTHVPLSLPGTFACRAREGSSGRSVSLFSKPIVRGEKQ